MACHAPHTPPSLTVLNHTVSHCANPCPNPTSKQQITSMGGGDEDEWINVQPPCNLFCSPPYLWQTASLHAILPLPTPSFEGLCCDCGQSVLHTYLLAPILCQDAHIKDCHFQRSGVSHAHKCCPDTWSGKIKTACLTIRVLCLWWVWLQRQVSQMSFPFSLSSSLLSFASTTVVGEIKIDRLCKLTAKEEVMVWSLVCLAVVNAKEKCDTADLSKHYYTH